MKLVQPLNKEDANGISNEVWIPLKELADITGLTTIRCGQIRKELKIKQLAPGQYPLKLFAKTYIASMRRRIEAAHTRNDSEAKRDLKDRELMVKVRNAELDFQERIGAVVVAADVEASALAEGKRTRDAAMRIGSRLASELAAETDPHAVRKRVDEEVIAMLEDLAQADDDVIDDDED
jgi:hypothetical protein